MFLVLILQSPKPSNFMLGFVSFEVLISDGIAGLCLFTYVFLSIYLISSVCHGSFCLWFYFYFCHINFIILVDSLNYKCFSNVCLDVVILLIDCCNTVPCNCVLNVFGKYYATFFLFSLCSFSDGCVVAVASRWVMHTILECFAREFICSINIIDHSYYILVHSNIFHYMNTLLKHLYNVFKKIVISIDGS